MESRCPGCGLILPEVSGPTHRYLESSAACWAMYSEVLAREYSDPALFRAIHRLTVDAYAAQHPGRPSPPSVSSVALHLLRLCAVLEHGAGPEEAARFMVEASRHKDRYGWLTPPDSLGERTVQNVWCAPEPGRHAKEVKSWARSVWEAWYPHHGQVREWYRAIQPACGRTR